MGWGTYGSRTTAVGGAALALAVRKVRDKAKVIAAHLLEAAVEDMEYEDGKFFVKGSPDQSKTIQDVALMAHVAWNMPEGHHRQGGHRMRDCNQGRFRQQISFLRRQFLQDGDLPFCNILSEQIVSKAVTAIETCWLDRIYPPLITLWVFLGQVLSQDHSCRAAVARLIAHRVSRGQRPCSAETGAYCQARKRLPEEFCSEVARQTGACRPSCTCGAGAATGSRRPRYLLLSGSGETRRKPSNAWPKTGIDSLR